jgi:hypothetical protein
MSCAELDFKHAGEIRRENGPEKADEQPRQAVPKSARDDSSLVV